MARTATISYTPGNLSISVDTFNLNAAVDLSSGGISFGPVVDAGGIANSLVADERFVWWGGQSGKVWRADLSKFTEPLVPAYAADMLSVGDGNALGTITSVMRSAGMTFFVDDGNGVQGEESTGILVASATLTVGDVRWNTQIDKVLRTIESRSAPTAVAGGNVTYDDATDTYDMSTQFYNGEVTSVSGTVKVQFTADTGIKSDLQTLTDKSETVVTPIMSGDKFTVVFTLLRDGSATTAGPQLESWLMQAFPSPTRIDEIVLPIVLKRRVGTSRGMGAATTVRAQTEYDTLRTLMVDKTVCTYEEGSRSEAVVIDQMSMAADRLSDDANWWDGILTVRLLTVPT